LGFVQPLAQGQGEKQSKSKVPRAEQELLEDGEC
jgi:hypothetical protein